MKLTKQKLKEIIKEEIGAVNELGMYEYLPEEPVCGELHCALEEIVERWSPVTPEGKQYEQQVLALISRFRPEED